MKTAFSYWGNRIAPVFDTTGEIQIIEAESGLVVRRVDKTLAEVVPVQRALHLQDLGIGTLVCGAISRPLHGLIVAYGIEVVPFVAGELDEVIQAWLGNRLETGTFIMPGCRGRGDLPGRSGVKREDDRMNGQGRGRAGKGCGQNQASGGPGRGRMGGSVMAGAVGNCLCPNCGYSEAHERRIPCGQKSCPQCGTTMARQ